MTQLAKERIEQKKLQGRPKKKRKKGRQPQKWQENIDGIERGKSLKNKMMKCMDNILDM